MGEAWRGDGLLGDVLPGDQGWGALEGVVTVHREATPVRSLDEPDWDALLATLSGKHRQQVRRFERRLAKSHDLAYRLSDGPDRLRPDLDAFFALHDKRWEGQSAAVDETSRAFFREFAAEAQRAGWLRLWLLELDGAPAAAFLGFRFGGAELYYQLGRDPAFDKLAVGRVLIAHTIRAALEDGAAEYRFLRGDEPYKDRFADYDPGLETVVLPRSLLGRLAVGGVSLLRRSERGRRWVADRAD